MGAPAPQRSLDPALLGAGLILRQRLEPLDRTKIHFVEIDGSVLTRPQPGLGTRLHRRWSLDDLMCGGKREEADRSNYERPGRDGLIISLDRYAYV